MLLGGRYKVKRLIGKGGMADVFLGTDTILNREVAVKVLHPNYAQDKDFIARFRQEAQAAANLNHPNVVSIFDWGSEGSIYFIVMEYIEGRSLKEIIDNEGKILPERAAEIAAETCSALQYAHRHNIVHRDIKPHNIIITMTGQVKVTDFGIARAGGGEAITRTGMVMGTAQYISPEQAQGMPVDGRSDIYSTGIMLYEMLTGRLPFDDPNPLAVAYKQVNEDPVAPSIIAPQVSPALEAIVMKSLAKNPDNRYASAREMRDDLLRFVEGMPVSAVPVMPVEMTKRADEPARGRKQEGKNINPAVWVVIGVLMAALITTGIIWAATSGGDTVVVPDIVGMSMREAQETLEAVGLRIKTVEEQHSTDVPAGNVISQEPEPESKIAKNRVVEIVLSKGALYVPDLKGLDLDTAKRTLETEELKLGEVSYEESDDANKGKVIGQNPLPAQPVSTGATVNLVLGKEREKVEVPDVRNKNEDEAVKILSDKGLSAAVSMRASDSVEKGKVVGSDPAHGTKVDKGTSITIYVSTGPEKVTVPNLIGLDKDDAVQRIRTLGLTERIVEQPVTDETKKGKVISQDPAAETQVDGGVTVTITVGKEN